MPDRYDVAIIGLGAMGSASAYHLARRGRSVVGFDRYRPPHGLGSSHGHTRIIREAYPEGAGYVPFVQRAYELWMELEAASGLELLTVTGGLVVDDAGGAAAATARQSALAGGIAIEELSAADVARRFPAFQLGDGQVAIYEPRAGVLSIDACISAHLEAAAGAGAEHRFDTVVEGWTGSDAGFELATSSGVVAAERLVVSAGPWLPGLIGAPVSALTVERQVQCWFEPLADGPELISIWPAATAGAYTIPDVGHGVKVAAHHGGMETTPDAVSRDVLGGDIEPLRAFIERHLPGVTTELRDASVCMYTNTPDGDFLIDALPADERVVVVSPCSGHGFKFASAVGEAVADLVATGATRQPTEAFRFDRAALVTPS